MIRHKYFILTGLLLAVVLLKSCIQSVDVPGVVVNHVPASTETYPSSPSICILPDGEYVASHDLFGPKSTEWDLGLTLIFKSSDKGKSWQKISEINGQFWSNLFVHRDTLYIMGPLNHSGNFIIRRSLDGGVTWTNPVSRKTGLLLEGEYHTAPVPVVIHKSRLWRALEHPVVMNDSVTHLCPMVISAPSDCNLLDADNWLASNYLLFDSTYLDGNFRNWLEGNTVVTPEGKLVDILRAETFEKGRQLAAIANVSDDGSTISFEPSEGFVDFVGGATKFTIRYDQQSKRYWAITNMVDKEFSDMNASSVRNKLILKNSPDLNIWTVNKVLLYHPDVKRHGFQYVDWQFDGNDIIFLSRTAYDDEYGGAHTFHDANYITFHRIKNFRNTENE